MAKLPRISAVEMTRALRRAGFLDDNQEGSHLSMRDPDTGRRVTIPMHPGDLPTRVTHKILKQAGLTASDLRRLLR